MAGSYKVSAREIEKLVDKLNIEPSGNLGLISSEAIHVAALQIQCKSYESLADYIVDMNLYIADAVNRRAQLVCLPAYAGLLPVGAIPHAHAFLEALEPPEREKENSLVDYQVLHDLLSYHSDLIFDSYFYTMSALASRHRIYIMAGSTLYFEDNDLCHRAFLFNDEGELAGYQDKISMGPLEYALQIPPETEVKLFDTRLGPMSILTCSDAYYYEGARIAKNLGARILLCPNLFVGEYTPVDSSLGPNMRAQENCVYAVQTTLVGDSGCGFTLEGGGRVFAPNELLKHKNGVAGKTSGAHRPDVFCMSLNLDKLDTVKNPYTLDKNAEFLQKYIDRLY